MDAKAYESPPRIDLRFFKAGTYKLYRKNPATTAWGTEIATVTVTAVPTTWSDTSVVVGELYEYGIGATTTTKPNYFGNVLAGINVDRTGAKGRLAVVVADDIPTQLPVEYAQNKADLVADGWVVHEIVTPRAADYLSNNTATNALATIALTAGGSGYTSGKNVVLTNGTATALGTLTVSSGAVTAVAVNYSGGGFSPGQSLTFTGDTGTGATLAVATVTSGTAEHINIRNQLIALYNAHPGELKNVVLVGKVAVARSGKGYVGPDGHGNRAAVGADAYYADMDGVWTDTGNNLSSYAAGTARSNAIKDGRINVPGDNKFDPTYFYEVTSPNSRLELGFGRVDLSNGVPSEYESMRLYFNKLHRYKTAASDFQPGRRVCNRMNAPPTGDTVQTAMLRSMPGLVGMENIQLVTNTEATSAVPPAYSADEDRDSAYTRRGGPFLFYFKGSGGPAWGLNGRAVFWTGLQSHWGYWFEPGNNSMVRRLAEDNFALSFTWSIWGTNFLYHRMGMGFDIGDMMRLSLNERTYSVNNYAVDSTPTGLFMNHMGCPSLRLFMFEPPSGLSVIPVAGNPSLSWTASPASGVIGYHIYRSAQPGGPYTRITTNPVVGTTHTDTDVSTGLWHYQVKAVRIETTGGGTYYNTSLGIQQSIDLSNPPATLVVSTASLPDASWNTNYRAELEATGGTPLFEWDVVSGALPPGLTLSTSGILTGAATAEGTYAFTVEATDELGQTAQQALMITSHANDVNTIFAEANSYCGSFNTTTWGFDEASLLLSGPVYLYQPFLRFDISSLVTNNNFVRAKLVVTLAASSKNSSALVMASMTQDSGDNWAESFSWASRPLDETSVKPVYASSLPLPYETIEFDVTDMVKATLGDDPAKKLGVRLSTVHANSFGNEVRIVTRYGPSASAPRLVIETTDAPAISFTSPQTNPAAVYLGSSLQINSVVTPIPENAGSLSVQWSQVSGPGPANFFTPNQASTLVSFPAAGSYVLRLAADDGVLSSFEDLMVSVYAIPDGTSPTIGTTAGLSLRLPLDEVSGSTATDYSGNGNTGSLVGAPARVPGRVGGALAFDGAVPRRVDVPDSATLDGQQSISVSFLVKPDTYPEWISGTAYSVGDHIHVDGQYYRCAIAHTATGASFATDYAEAGALGTVAISAGGSGYSNGGAVTLTAGSSTATGTMTVSSGKITAITITNWGTGFSVGQALTITPAGAGTGATGTVATLFNGWVPRSSIGMVSKRRIAGSNDSYGCYLNSANQVVAEIDRTTMGSTGSLTPSTWQHVAVVFEGGLGTNVNNFKIYINGYLDRIGYIAETTVPRNTTAPLRIGALDDMDLYGFRGQLDEVRVYNNKVLAVAEVQELAMAAPSNVGPRIVLDDDSVTGPAGQPIGVGASVTDPGDPGVVSLGWSKAFGPGTVSFSNMAVATTSAIMSLEGEYVLRLTATDGGIITFADVMASISPASGPMDFSGWAISHDLPGDGTGLGAPDAKPANDGITNAMKFALGIDPHVAGYQGHMTQGTVTESGETYLSLTYVRPEPPPVGVSYAVKTRGDMSSGTVSDAVEFSSTPDVPAPGLRTVVARDTVPMSDHEAMCFIHLEVVVPSGGGL